MLELVWSFLFAAAAIYILFMACVIAALVINLLRERRRPTPLPPPASMYLPSVEPTRKLAQVRSQAERVSEPQKSADLWLRSQALRANDHIGDRAPAQIADYRHESRRA